MEEYVDMTDAYEFRVIQFNAERTGTSPENWEMIQRRKVRPRVVYDWVDLDLGRNGQCWADANGVWAEPPLGARPEILEWVGQAGRIF